MKTIRRLVSLVPWALSPLVVAACSSAPASSTGEAAGNVEQASSKPYCRTVVLDAAKSYGHPSTYTDGTASAAPEMRFDVPHTIAVTAGKSGDGTVTLSLRRGSHATTCTYRGGGDCDGWARDASHRGYRLEHCSSRLDGDDAVADSFRLHVDDGDSRDPAHQTAVEVTLTEEGNCRRGPPPADAGAPPPADSGPAAPTCTADAQCNDGNACTTDACTGGACTHAAAADGAACDDGNSCTTGDACTAGKCGGTAAADGAACDDSLGCTTGGTCTAGKCGGATAAPDGTACGATDLCVFSNTATCAAGACTGTPDCGGSECVSSACAAATGACMPSPAGTPCSTGTCDGNYNCVAGSATASVTSVTPLCAQQSDWECYAAAGTFSSSSSGCVHAALPSGTACSAGVCDGSGNCVATASGPGNGVPLVLGPACPPNGACTSPGSIDFATGACVYVNLLAGTACGAGGHCDGNGACGP